jgi:membrane-associated protease RseP (regulator of RpoE activity)
MQEPTVPEAAKDIEFIKSLVAKRFPVYDVRVNYDVFEFLCRVDEATLDERFEELREEMGGHGFIPMITYVGGEHVIVVGRKPTPKYRSVYVNLTMLVITFLAMLFAGILDWASYADVPDGELFSLTNILTGMVVFTLPLMAILGVHELGHYFMARKRKVAASLPFFIPSIPPLGTFGAFISLRDPIPNKKTLLEIGVAGPLAGMLLAIPLGIAGLILTNMEARPVPEDLGEGSVVRILFPMIYQWMEDIVPIQGDYLLHPTAFAAWVGFLVTALNLLPAGQLDGGHISRALFGSNAKYASWATIAALIVIGIMLYTSWLIFAVLIIFLGAKHPPPLNDLTKLDMKRRALGYGAFLVLIIAFVPVPMIPVTVEYTVDMSTVDGIDDALTTPGANVYFELSVQNLGNTRNNITVADASGVLGWTVAFKLAEENDTEYREELDLSLRVDANATVDLLVRSPSDITPGNYTVVVQAHPTVYGDDETNDAVLDLNLTVEQPSLTFTASSYTLAVPPGMEGSETISVENDSGSEAELTFIVAHADPYIAAVLFEGPAVGDGTTELVVIVDAGATAEVTVQVLVWGTATPGERSVVVEALYGESVIQTFEFIVEV